MNIEGQRSRHPDDVELSNAENGPVLNDDVIKAIEGILGISFHRWIDQNPNGYTPVSGWKFAGDHYEISLNEWKEKNIQGGAEVKYSIYGERRVRYSMKGISKISICPDYWYPDKKSIDFSFEADNVNQHLTLSPDQVGIYFEAGKQSKRAGQKPK